MKTSNKLLLGLFSLIVVSMIVTNITIKHELDKYPTQKNNVEDTLKNDSTSTHTKSIHINF
jgi:t-SNARE complex subunit (syntaxin)